MIPPLPTDGQTPNTKQMAAAVEAKLREIQDVTANLLGDIDTAWSGVAGMMRAKAARLNEIGFVLTRCLCNGDVETAYGMIIGNDVDGEVWGLTA